MLRSLARWLYLASRTTGDINAASRGTLGRRLVRRQERRIVNRSLRKWGL